MLELNGREVRAAIGDTLVEAGLGGRIVLPHDCCSGQCETCRVEVISGSVDDQGTARGRTVLACQATVEGDAAIFYEHVPVPRSNVGGISSMRSLSPDIVEVRIALNRALAYLPGQYVGVKFSGYPLREYSPAPDLDGGLDDSVLSLHVRRLPGGMVSGDLGRNLLPGHPVRVRGPFGSAFLRERASRGRLVLMSTGTGFAPIWSIARAACRAGRQSAIEMVVAVRDGQNFYMAEALDWLRQHGVRRINVVNGRNPVPAALRGRPTDYMPLLGPLDEVYVAGAPAFVAAVQDRALAAGAACHADPFLPSQGSLSLRDRVTRLLGHRPRRVAATVAKPEVIAPLGAADSWAAAWNQRAGTRH